MKKLTNKTVLITGAASGMGKAMAELFAQEGARVLLTDIHEDGLKAVTESINAVGGKANWFTANVGDEAQVEQLFLSTIAAFESIDIVVNNAGVMDDFMPVDQLTTEQWQRTMNININGPFYVCRKAVQQFLKQGSGVILNIASIGGLQGARAGAAYTASKHALVGLTRNIGFMYANKGIRCNAIAPGGVNTNIGLNMHPNPFGAERCMSGSVNNPRMGEPSEIARTALFLVSDDASFVNGAIVTADGGWTAY